MSVIAIHAMQIVKHFLFVLQEDIELRPDIETNKILLPPQEEHAPLQNELEEPRTREDEINQDYLNFLRKQVAINHRYEKFRAFFTYEYFKETTKWFLDTATFDITFSVSSASVSRLPVHHRRF
jgi:hypothetical protein